MGANPWIIRVSIKAGWVLTHPSGRFYLSAMLKRSEVFAKKIFPVLEKMLEELGIKADQVK